MKLKIVHGLAEAEGVLARFDPLDMDSLPESVLERTRQAFGQDTTPEQSVIKMLADVRREGDAAVRRYTALLDGVELDDCQVSTAETRRGSLPNLPRTGDGPAVGPPSASPNSTSPPFPATGLTWSRVWVKWWCPWSGWGYTRPAARPPIPPRS